MCMLEIIDIDFESWNFNVDLDYIAMGKKDAFHNLAFLHNECCTLS